MLLEIQMVNLERTGRGGDNVLEDFWAAIREEPGYMLLIPGKEVKTLQNYLSLFCHGHARIDDLNMCGKNFLKRGN